jgi:hypothetical protein
VVAIVVGAVAFLVGHWYFGRPPEDGNFKQFIGRVIDAATEQGIRGAKVSLEAEGLPSVKHTDSNGVVTFWIEKKINNIHVRIAEPDYEKFDSHINVSMITAIEDIRIHRITPSYSNQSSLLETQSNSKDKPLDSICDGSLTEEPQYAKFDFVVFPKVVNRGGITCITANKHGTFQVFLQTNPLEIEMISGKQFIAKIPKDLHPSKSYIYIHWIGRNGEVDNTHKLIAIE